MNVQRSRYAVAGLFGVGLVFLGTSVVRTTAAATQEKDAPLAVRPGANGRLIYAADAHGNHVPDFSNVGYRGGDAPLPGVVPVRATVAPGTDDAGARIQAAIDAVGKLPLGKDGYRGAVLLKRGTYPIAGVIRIHNSGVVLRGEGEGADGTVLLATGSKQRSLVVVSGGGAQAGSSGDGESGASSGGNGPREVPNSRVAITDEYVPVGARTFHVEKPNAFRIGETVIVRRPSTAEWIHEIGMDRIPMAKDGKTVQWKPGSKDLLFDRVVTKVQGNTVTVDAPLCNAFEKQYGGGTVYRYTFPTRIEHVGVENLRGDSEYKSPTDEDHGWKFISFDAVQNAWARHVTAIHYGYSCVAVERNGKWITVQDCTNLDPVSQITGGRRYAFCLSGQLTLFERCHSREGRHDFVLHSTVAGPNAFVDCDAVNAHADTGPHHRWSVGCLFDNVRVSGEGGGVGINIRNRGSSGTGHGWAGANQVLWNCEAPHLNIASPPTAQNWAIGCKTPDKKGNGIWQSVGTRVEPRSLYRAQLAERRKQNATRR